jgi:hypothetical protein
VRLAPTSDQPPYFVERSGGMLIAPSVQEPEIAGHAQEEPQLVYTQIRLAEVGFSVSRERRRHKQFEHIEADIEDAIAEHEFVGFGESINCRYEPKRN